MKKIKIILHFLFLNIISFFKIIFNQTGANILEYYKVLGLKPNCAYSEIKAAYYRLAKIYHPDNQQTGNPEKFLEISKAYEYLMKHIELTHQADSKTPTHYVPDIFLDATITLKEAFNGTTVSFTPDDNRLRTIKIPAGILSKKVVIEPNQGNKTVNGTVGDIIATVYIQREEGFSFEDGELVQDVDVDIIKAIIGGKISIIGIDDTIIKFDIPQGFQEGYQFYIENKGWKKLWSKERGKLKVRLHIKNRLIELTDKEIRQLKNIGNK